MKIAVLFIVMIAGLFAATGQSLQPLYKDLPNDSLTGLQQKYLVSDFYLTYGVNPATGTVDSTQQALYIYYYIVKYDIHGNPYMCSDKYIKVIKQGTEEFNTWYNSFEQFGIIMHNTVDTLAYPPKEQY